MSKLFNSKSSYAPICLNTEGNTCSLSEDARL